MSDFRSYLSNVTRKYEFWLLAANLLVIVYFSIATNFTFLSLGNFLDLFDSYTVQAIIALGLFVVLISGGIDISFAGTAALTQYMIAWLLTQSGLPPVLAVAAGLLAGVSLGAVNATLIYYGRITSIIATIATMSIYMSLIMYMTSTQNIYDLPLWLTQPRVLFAYDTGQDYIRVTLDTVIVLVCVLLTWFCMARTSVGRQIYAMGGNGEAARRIGINIPLLHFVVYGFLGFMAALAGIMQMHRIGEAVPSSWIGTELPILSAAVLGGASLNGGRGSVPGVLLGLILLAMLQNGLNLSGVSSYLFSIFAGLVILLSTTLAAVNARSLKRRKRLEHATGEA